LITRNAVAATVAVGATALMTVAAIPASASTATRTQTIGACVASGYRAGCSLNVQASKPVIMHARVTAAPNQTIKGQYSFTCSKGSRGSGEVGAFDSRGPHNLKLTPGVAKPTSCSLSISGHLPAHSGKLQVTVTATDKA
jgi:hypothetical protein